MKEKHYCGLCLKESSSVEDLEEICNSCLDLLEFGYPSFPAYRLEEETNGSFIPHEWEYA